MPSAPTITKDWYEIGISVSAGDEYWTWAQCRTAVDAFSYGLSGPFHTHNAYYKPTNYDFVVEYDSLFRAVMPYSADVTYYSTGDDFYCILGGGFSGMDYEDAKAVFIGATVTTVNSRGPHTLTIAAIDGSGVGNLIFSIPHDPPPSEPGAFTNVTLV